MKTLLLAARPRTRQLLGEALKRRNHEVTVVEDAEAACAAFQPGGHRLVILEIDGRHEEGVRLCRRLRALSPRGHCLILAASQAPQPEQVDEWLAAGADDYLTELDDPRRLEVRLAVAEHRLDRADDSASGQGAPFQRWGSSVPPFDGGADKSSPLLADAPYGAFRATVDGRFLEVNPALVEMLGYDSAEELLAVDIGRDVFRDPARRQPLVSQVTEHGRLDGFEAPWKRKDGTPITILGSSRAVCDGRGKVVYFEGIVHNITQQKLAEEALRESEQRFRSVFDNAVEGILLADTQRKEMLMGNPAICQMLGYSQEEIRSLTVMDVHPQESLPEAMAEFERQVKGKRSLGTEIPMKRKDGSVFYADVNSFPMTWAGKPCLVGVFRDVTERRRTELALHESEAMLRNLFDNLPNVVIIVDRDAKIKHLNRTVSGPPAAQRIGTTGLESIAPEYRETCRQRLQRTIETRRVQRVECLGVHGVWWDCCLIPMIEKDEVRNVMIICTDVTQRRAATEALQKEQRLLRQLLDLHERDRQLTAYEIHDGFSQYLTGALYNLQAFRELLAKSPLEAWRTFDTGVSLIRRSINEARRLIGGLRPPILDESGIVAAIDYLACETEEHEEAEVEFIHDVKFQRLAPPLESAIFRIVQESLNNARRYSQSAKIRIELRQRDDHVCIAVRDWGVGFDPERTAEGRFGLQGIRERVRLFGGQVTIETAPGKGTHVSVELPLIERAQEPSQP